MKGQTSKYSTDTKNSLRTKTAKRKPLRQKSRKVPYLVIVGVLVFLSLLYFVAINITGPKKTVRTETQTIDPNIPPIVIDRKYDSTLDIVRAKLELVSMDNKDVVRLIIDKEGRKDDRVEYRYIWKKNGVRLADSGDSVTGFKRGDHVSVTVTAFHGDRTGQSKTIEMEVANATPRLTTSPEVTFDGKTLLVQVKATDPDGDPVRYSLLDAPAGMMMNETTGSIRWEPDKNFSGEREIKVKVTDGKGAEMIYPVKIRLEPPPDIPIQPAKK